MRVSLWIAIFNHMKTITAIIPLLISLAMAPLVRCDWTIPLPDPRPAEYSVQPSAGGPGGVVVVIIEHYPSNRFLWYSTNGVLLVDRVISGASASEVAFINPRQVVVQNAGDWRNFHLVTSNGPGDYTIKDYSLSSSQNWHLIVGQPEPQDSTGFYYTDDSTWTLTRVDFPKPPPLPGAAVSLKLESAEKVEGPWQSVTTIEVPAEKPQQFFRLAADSP